MNSSTETATFYLDYKVDLSSTILSKSFTVAWGIGGNYKTGSSCPDNTIVITVSAPANDFVTGGGFIIPTNSGGTIGGTPVNGLKNNFGFNLKFNKAGRLQGNWNTIIRRSEINGTITMYQVKSNVTNSILVTSGTYSSGMKWARADMSFNSANFQNLTNPLMPVNANNGDLMVSVIDNGEPGSGVDRILITIKNSDGSVWYTSDQAANHSISYNKDLLQLLNAGNIQVRSGATAPPTASLQTMTFEQRVIAPQLIVEKLEAKAYPNPSSDQFAIKLESNSKEPIRLEIFNEIGRSIEVKYNLIEGQTINLGSKYRMGTYFVKALQRKKSKVIKIVKIS